MEQTKLSIIASEEWRTALYLRLSKEDGDKEESDSIAGQRGLLLSHIGKNLPDVTVVAEKVDDGFSGATFQRPRFIEMMEGIRAGKINCVIVKDAYVKYGLKIFGFFVWHYIKILSIVNH